MVSGKKISNPFLINKTEKILVFTSDELAGEYFRRIMEIFGRKVEIKVKKYEFLCNNLPDKEGALRELKYYSEAVLRKFHDYNDVTGDEIMYWSISTIENNTPLLNESVLSKEIYLFWSKPIFLIWYWIHFIEMIDPTIKSSSDIAITSEIDIDSDLGEAKSNDELSQISDRMKRVVLEFCKDRSNAKKEFVKTICSKNNKIDFFSCFNEANVCNAINVAESMEKKGWSIGMYRILIKSLGLN